MVRLFYFNMVKCFYFNMVRLFYFNRHPDWVEAWGMPCWPEPPPQSPSGASAGLALVAGTSPHLCVYTGTPHRGPQSSPSPTPTHILTYHQQDVIHTIRNAIHLLLSFSVLSPAEGDGRALYYLTTCIYSQIYFSHEQNLCLYINRSKTERCVYVYTVGKISIWPHADFASLTTCKEIVCWYSISIIVIVGVS